MLFRDMLWRVRMMMTVIVAETAVLSAIVRGLETQLPMAREISIAMLSFALLAYALAMLLLLRGKVMRIERDLVVWGTYRTEQSQPELLDGFARPDEKPPKADNPVRA